MSNRSPNDPDGRRRQVKSPETSNFVQTCNLLSQFVKRKGSLNDLNLEIGGRVESLEAIVNHRSRCSAEDSNQSPPAGAINIGETAAAAVGKKPITAQLTIFYGGRVLIFDEYPENRAKELVAMARKGSSQMSYGIFSCNFPQGKPSPIAAASSLSPRDGRPPRPQLGGSRRHSVISSHTCKADHSGATASSSKADEPLEANGSGLPIARRSCLHRFLDKRKDRGGGRGPYHVQEQEAASSAKRRDEQLKLSL